jgi:hypothetical protein
MDGVRHIEAMGKLEDLHPPLGLACRESRSQEEKYGQEAVP